MSLLLGIVCFIGAVLANHFGASPGWIAIRIVVGIFCLIVWRLSPPEKKPATNEQAEKPEQTTEESDQTAQILHKSYCASNPDRLERTDSLDAERIMEDPVEDFSLIAEMERMEVGLWQQYDIRLAEKARYYFWKKDAIINWAQYMADGDLKPINTLSADMRHSGKTEFITKYREFGDRIANIPDLAEEEWSSLSVGGNSKTLQSPVKIVWIHLSESFQILSLVDDELQMRKYAETVIRRTFGTENAMKLAKPIPLIGKLEYNQSMSRNGTVSKPYLLKKEDARDGFSMRLYDLNLMKKPIIRLLGNTIRVGRTPECDLLTDNTIIDKNQAVIICDRRQGDKLFCWTIEDMDSANGTYLNGRRLGKGEKAVLRPGDIISFAKRWSFEILDFDDPHSGSTWERDQYPRDLTHSWRANNSSGYNGIYWTLSGKKLTVWGNGGAELSSRHETYPGDSDVHFEFNAFGMPVMEEVEHGQGSFRTWYWPIAIITSLELLVGIRRVSEYSLKGLYCVSSITFGGSVEEISYWLFDAGCRLDIDSIKILNPTCTIDKNAFSYCVVYKIIGYPGSTAEQFAREMDIPFEALKSPVNHCVNLGENENIPIAITDNMTEPRVSENEQKHINFIYRENNMELPPLSDFPITLSWNGREVIAMIHFAQRTLCDYLGGGAHDVGEWYDHLDVMSDVILLSRLRVKDKPIELGSDEWGGLLRYVAEINDHIVSSSGHGAPGDAVWIEYPQMEAPWG